MATATQQPLEKQQRPVLAGWRDVLPVHPAADLFPLMSEAELLELGRDIKANGLRTPITIWAENYDGNHDSRGFLLLDGRNRLDAMEAVGMQIVCDNEVLVDCEDRYGNTNDPDLIADPYQFVISANLIRRHLTSEQKRDLIAKVLKAKPEQSNRTIAKQVKADDKTVAKVRTELEARSDIPNVTERTDTKGRKQPARKSSSAPKPSKLDKSAAALNEFKYACKTWLPKMTAEHQAEAIKIASDMVTP